MSIIFETLHVYVSFDSMRMWLWFAQYCQIDFYFSQLMNFAIIQQYNILYISI